jgi:glyoxylase-like metal-dependent hydrolase (beta-lactamase superfamily II)
VNGAPGRQGQPGQAKEREREEQDQEREALELAARAGIHRLAVPTPFKVGRVNAYLIEDSPLTLVDSGPNSGLALDELELALGARGHAVEDLELLVITHQHLDHFGLASILARRSGSEVAALDRVVPYLSGYAEQAERDDAFAEGVMLANGVPADVVGALRAVAATFRGWGAAVAVDRPLADGGELRLAGRTLQVLHRPGHSPSDTIFLDESSSILLTGDHLIRHISSNALVTRPLEPSDEEARPAPLLDYIASLEATRAMEVSLLLPGHGAPISDHVSLIDERRRLHERRARKIHGVIRSHPRSGYEIASELWGNIAVTQAYFTLSEVLGHIDLLLAEGVVGETRRDGVIIFEAL